MTPQISIIVPTYNGAGYVGRTIRSVLNQTVENWEMIVVNDGSSDQSVAAAEGAAAGDPRVRIVSQSNTGIGGARNRGFRESNPLSKYVLFLDHDDLLEPYALELLRDEFERSPEASMVYGQVRFIDQDGRGIHPKDRNFYFFQHHETRGRRVEFKKSIVIDPGFETWICQNMIMSPGAVLISRHAFVEVGGFDQEVAPCDDWDLWMRLSLVGQTHSVSEFVLAYRQHATNTSNQTDVMWRAHWAAWSKWMTLPLDGLQRESAATFLRHVQLAQMKGAPRVEDALAIARSALSARGGLNKRCYCWVERDPTLLIACEGSVDLHDLILSASTGQPDQAAPGALVLSASDRKIVAQVYRRLQRMQASLAFGHMRMHLMRCTQYVQPRLLIVSLVQALAGAVNGVAALTRSALSLPVMPQPSESRQVESVK